MKRMLPREIEGLDDYITTFADAAIAGNLTGFKGTWVAAPETLIYSQDFSVDLGAFTGIGSRIAMSSAQGTSKPAYSYADEGSANPTTNPVVASLDLAAIAAGRTLTRLNVWYGGWHRTTNSTYSRQTKWSVDIDGAIFDSVTSPSTYTYQLPWRQATVLNPVSGVFNARMAKAGTFSDNFLACYMGITGFELYAAPLDWTGYKLGDSVAYKGRMFISNADDNQDEPTVGAGASSWTEVPLYATPKAPNAQTGTTYTLVLDDVSKLVTMTNAAASTLTVPPNSSVAFPLGTQVDVSQLGTGTLTVAAGSGVTIVGLPLVMVTNRNVRLIKTGTDTWLALPSAVPAAAQAPNAQTGTTYTLAFADAVRPVTLSNAAAITLTVPTNASIAFPVGTRITVVQAGAGGVTFTPAAGVTINNNSALAAQWSRADLLKTGTDTWVKL